MTLSLFGPPTTNWLTERRRREGEALGPYDRAINMTARDVSTAARGAAAPGGGAAAARDASQAMAPEIARLRASQANALGAANASVERDIRAEMAAQRDFGNQLFGGLAGIAGQALVPLISGLGSGGQPAGGSAPAAGGGLGSMLGAAAPIATAINPGVGLGMGAASGLLGAGAPPASGAGAALYGSPEPGRGSGGLWMMPPSAAAAPVAPMAPPPVGGAMVPGAGGLTPEEEERRRREAAAAAMGGSSPYMTPGASGALGLFR